MNSCFLKLKSVNIVLSTEFPVIDTQVAMREGHEGWYVGTSLFRMNGRN